MPSRHVFLVPLALTLGVAAISFIPRVQSNLTLTRSFWTATAVLLVWQLALFLRLRREGVGRSFRVELRLQHYLQAALQVILLGYWGWYWRPVYDMAWLMVAQVAFAYAVDMLLTWSRRDSYVLGFGPIPITLSINLFLWFRDDWFYLQFLMIAIGFLGKGLVRWQREGRSMHIFNPSAFSLVFFSLVLIATNTTDLTWGEDIASTLAVAPRIYLVLFLIGLVVMYYFSITLIAGFAAAVLFASSAVYSTVTGVPYFIDSEIPAAVFLGLHLLVTDPSTSPRTPLGKSVFGILYGLGVFGLYALLEAVGAPTFYDKLLCMPLLNLAVRRIDAVVSSLGDVPAVTRWRFDWASARANLAYMAVWIALFGSMTAIGKTDGRHTGDSLPFWEQACADGRRNACERLLSIEAVYCGDNSAWACNELGVHYTDGAIERPDPELALGYFSRACELRFQAACVNVLDPGTVSRADPKVLDLRLLLRERKQNLMEMPEPELYARACEHGWAFACDLVSPSP
ncbi:MAG: SEL1-like repeat protein [Vicinamibacterales bacterium]|nr:SEL1-like repeat protein [Vicinamibacterales bacterium]MDP6610442.1 SEL1-like repeat protein [Vicinamibacterales bacterium]HAK53851.1 hypothetical protein [Acidobacteriota bacterium]